MQQDKLCILKTLQRICFIAQKHFRNWVSFRLQVDRWSSDGNRLFETTLQDMKLATFHRKTKADQVSKRLWNKIQYDGHYTKQHLVLWESKIVVSLQSRK